MLKRIKKIQNVGRFKSCQGGDAEFDKITFVFGRNTYGKTTLGDILASISNGDTSVIKARKTIPIDPSDQKQNVELKFTADGTPGETTIRLNGAQWEPQLPGNLRLHVFDDGFYHTNLFAGREFTRDTKVNFSAFVLGERGVAKAKEIAAKNKQKGDATRERTKLQKAAFADIADLPQFLAMTPTETAEAVDAKVTELRREYDALSKRQKNADKIRTRKNLEMLAWIRDCSSAVSTFNNALSSSLDTHHESARKAIAEHIKATFSHADNAESWIRQGLGQNKGTHCQLCGQLLTEEALHLLEIYRKSFDTSFQLHEKSVASALASAASVLLRERISALRLAVETNYGTVQSYSELEDDEQLQKERNNLDVISVQLGEFFEQWDKQKEALEAKIAAAHRQKLAAPLARVEEIDMGCLTKVDEKLTELVSNYNDGAVRINEIYRTFKATLLDNSVAERLQKITEQGKAEARKLERLKRMPQCNEYLEHSALIERLAAEIPALQLELANDQSEYIDKFFERLNRFFEMFGSRNFTLDKGKDDSGHTPVYYLKVKLNGIDVSERDLARAFSESDRRALALAVFWSGLDGLTAAEKSSTIVVLDDPVTSFDTHRMTTVHQVVAGMADHVRQVIVFSHFRQGICQFLTTYRKNKPVKLLQIERAGEMAKIEAPDVEMFLKNEHEKTREKILGFCCGTTNLHAAADLRVFLEVEISYRFAKQLVGVNEENLSDRINRLQQLGAITLDTAAEAHTWRETLNPAHHVWTEADIEDQRNTATRFVDFVYHRLVPTSHVGVSLPNAA